MRALGRVQIPSRPPLIAMIFRIDKFKLELLSEIMEKFLRFVKESLLISKLSFLFLGYFSYRYRTFFRKPFMNLKRMFILRLIAL